MGLSQEQNPMYRKNKNYDRGEQYDYQRHWLIENPRHMPLSYHDSRPELWRSFGDA